MRATSSLKVPTNLRWQKKSFSTSTQKRKGVRMWCFHGSTTGHPAGCERWGSAPPAPMSIELSHIQPTHSTCDLRGETRLCAVASGELSASRSHAQRKCLTEPAHPLHAFKRSPVVFAGFLSSSPSGKVCCRHGTCCSLALPTPPSWWNPLAGVNICPSLFALQRAALEAPW